MNEIKNQAASWWKGRLVLSSPRVTTYYCDCVSHTIAYQLISKCHKCSLCISRYSLLPKDHSKYSFNSTCSQHLQDQYLRHAHVAVCLNTLENRKISTQKTMNKWRICPYRKQTESYHEERKRNRYFEDKVLHIRDRYYEAVAEKRKNRPLWDFLKSKNLNAQKPCLETEWFHRRC